MEYNLGHQEDRVLLKVSARGSLAACAAVVLLFSSAPGGAPTTMNTQAVIDLFNAAFNAHDAKAVESLLTDDTVFEDTSPAPDGLRIEGKSAVAAFWREWFARNPDAHFEAEELIVSGNRAVVRWVYRKKRNGVPWHLRGVDVFTVRNGKVAAKLAYVKG
jgi:ketosteroid isomerase-like protein